MKGATKTIKNETKEQKGGFLSMLLGNLGASLLGNLLSRKGTVRAGEEIVRAGYGSLIGKNALITPHPLTNFEIKEYYENEPRFNGVYSRDNLPKTIKDGSYVINLDEYPDVGTHWIALYVRNNEVIYFDSFGLNMFLKKPKDLLDIKTYIFRIKQTYLDTSRQFSNLWILLYWIHIFYVCRKKFD